MINNPLNINRNNDNIAPFHIGLEDHDNAVFYYLQNNIKPQVEENGQLIDVPIIFGSPERWKSVRVDGYYRSADKQIMRPLIMIKRTGFEKRRNVTRNLDPSDPLVTFQFAQNYNTKNKYDQFSAIYNSKPKKIIRNLVVPDYITVSYTMVVWTDYMTDMNKIIEAIQYGESTYWGDGATNFKFYTTAGGFSDTIELTAGEDRLLRTSCDITVQGYLVPNTIQKTIAQKSEVLVTNNQVAIKIEAPIDILSSRRSAFSSAFSNGFGTIIPEFQDVNYGFSDGYFGGYDF